MNLKTANWLGIFALLLVCVLVGFAEEKTGQSAIDIGSRLELFVDDYLIDKIDDSASMVLHRPIRREVVMVTDKPWEGNACSYRTVFKDGDKFKMYYTAYRKAKPTDKGDKTKLFGSCLAVSDDGINWVRPNLGLYEFDGSKDNNLIFAGKKEGDVLDGAKIEPCYLVAVFKDTNPACLENQRYKAIVKAAPMSNGSVYAMASPDGIKDWKLMSPEPVITEGWFDSQNLAFYDNVGKEYRAYTRDIDPRDLKTGVRGIRTCSSKDFVHWSQPVWLKYDQDNKQPLYTNQVIPYYRAPHIFVGFPMRYNDRGWSESMKKLPGLDARIRRSKESQRYGTAITDALFMSSRDGVHFNRWLEAFIRPAQSTWVYGDNLIAWGILETRSSIPDAPNELSIYVTDRYWEGESINICRYTLRMDGFVSIQGPFSGAEFTTKPVIFSGSQLFINFSSSAAGGIRVELQDESGKPLEGFTLDDCPEMFADSVEYPVYWKNDPDLSKLTGKPVRLRFVLKDADIYAFQFK